MGIKTDQGCFESIHFVGLSVNENDLRRFQSPYKAARLLVVGVRGEADVRHLVHFVIY